MSTVVVLGASPKPGRFAHMAVVKLKQAGHTVLPVHPKAEEIEGLKVFASLEDIDQSVDTVTLYVGPARMQALVEQVIAMQPARVILNPGTEDPDIEQQLTDAGIECVRDCTLVMLDQARFD